MHLLPNIRSLVLAITHTQWAGTETCVVIRNKPAGVFPLLISPGSGDLTLMGAAHDSRFDSFAGLRSTNGLFVYACRVGVKSAENQRMACLDMIFGVITVVLY